MAEKRKPRKKGQHTGSPNHSDLYTNEREEGTIRGLGFKDAATARKGVATVNKAKRAHAHKVQATLVMKQRAKVAKERAKDPEKKKNLNAAYKIWSDHLEKLKKKTAKKNEGLVRQYVKSMLEFSVKANKKNTHQDGTSKSRGYMSGIDKTWTGDDTNDELHGWYKQMGLMEEYIRELLSESAIHPGIAKYIKIAKNEGMRITIKDHGNGGVVYIENAESHYGALTWRAPTKMDGPCLGKMIVAQSEAYAGYGPLLYDIAIEYTGGLAPDRNTVSLEARRVWQYYDERRPDVFKDQLDDLFNRLTPEEEDNCYDMSVMDDDDALGHERSALSRAYRKAGTPVIDKLKEMGMIDIK